MSAVRNLWINAPNLNSTCSSDHLLVAWKFSTDTIYVPSNKWRVQKLLTLILPWCCSVSNFNQLSIEYGGVKWNGSSHWFPKYTMSNKKKWLVLCTFCFTLGSLSLMATRWWSTCMSLLDSNSITSLVTVRMWMKKGRDQNFISGSYFQIL